MHDDQDGGDLQRLGEVIGGRYVLGDLLGIGGMGVVYAAIQRPAGRTVAIKLPRRELASDPAGANGFTPRRSPRLESRIATWCACSTSATPTARRTW